MKTKTIIGLLIGLGLIVGSILLILWKQGIIFKSAESDDTSTTSNSPDVVRKYLMTFASRPKERFESTDSNVDGIDSLYQRYKFIYDIAKANNFNICKIEETEKNNMETKRKMMDTLMCLAYTENENLEMLSVIAVMTADNNKEGREETKFEYDERTDTIVVGKILASYFEKPIDGIEIKTANIPYEEFKTKILDIVKTNKESLKENTTFIRDNNNCFNENRCLPRVNDPK